MPQLPHAGADMAARFYVHPTGACLDAITAQRRIRHTLGIELLPFHVSLRAPIGERLYLSHPPRRADRAKTRAAQPYATATDISPAGVVL